MSLVSRLGAHQSVANISKVKNCCASCILVNKAGPHAGGIMYNQQFVPVVPHKAVAKVSRIRNIEERLVFVNHGWQSEPTDGSEGTWNVGLSTCLSVSLSICLFVYLSVNLSVYLSVYSSIHPSISLAIYLSIYHLSI